MGASRLSTQKSLIDDPSSARLSPTMSAAARPTPIRAIEPACIPGKGPDRASSPIARPVRSVVVTIPMDQWANRSVRPKWVTQEFGPRQCGWG